VTGAGGRGAALPSDAELVTELGAHLGNFLQLAALASAAHDEFAFGDSSAALRFYEQLHRGGGADFAPPAGRLLLVGGRPAGMFALVPPDLLKRRRLVGGLVAARAARAHPDPALTERLRRAAGVLARPGSGDGYLSRLAIHPAMSGRGLGRLLLHEALAAARSLGLARCVLEVADTNDRAIALYRSAGFEQIDRASTTDPESGARLGFLHLARAL
jgi:ribosomal protein S18 acetylase RimI-like enzyme